MTMKFFCRTVCLLLPITKWLSYGENYSFEGFASCTRDSSMLLEFLGQGQSLVKVIYFLITFQMRVFKPPCHLPFWSNRARRSEQMSCVKNRKPAWQPQRGKFSLSSRKQVKRRNCEFQFSSPCASPTKEMCRKQLGWERRTVPILHLNMVSASWKQGRRGNKRPERGMCSQY